MPVSAKPSRNNVQRENKPTASEKQVLAVINKGGRSTQTSDYQLDELKRIQLRLYESQIAEIDRAVEALKQSRKRIPTFSRHKWIVEAITEKLSRQR